MNNKSENPSVLCASLMAGTGVINGFTEAMMNVFTGGYYTLNVSDPNFNTTILEMTRVHRPSVVFIQIQQDGILRPEVAKELSKLSYVIQFSGDIRHDTEAFYYEIGKNIQMTCFSNMRDVANCRKFGIRSEWLEIGFDPQKYRSWPNNTSLPEIVAHFNHYDKFPLSNYRKDIVEKLRNAFGNKFGVFGTFPGSNGNFNHDQVAESVNYCGAKIAINCSHFFCDMYSSDRILRIMGSGVMCLSHHFPSIDKMYTVGKHLDTFNSLDEMIRKCHYYLEHVGQREAIAKAGQEWVLQNYTFLHMANNIKKLYLNG